MGNKCQSCGKPNHFARKCKSKVPSQVKSKKPVRQQIQMLKEQSKIPMVSHNEVVQNTSDNDFTWSVSQNQMNKDRPVFPEKVNGVKVKFLADSGISVNILSLTDYNRLQSKPSLEYHNKYVYAYGSDVPLDTRGKFMAKLASDNATCGSSVIVSGESDKSILSLDMSCKLRLIVIYLFGVLRRFQHYTGHITTGSWKGRGNQYIQFTRVVCCKLPTNGKQLPAFPLKAVTGIEPRPQRWEARVLPVCHRGPTKVDRYSKES